MKTKLLVMILLPSACSNAFASGTSRIIESETMEIALTNPPQLELQCEPGRGGRTYPTSSTLILKKAGGFFAKSKLDWVAYSDFPNLGDTCATLKEEFLRKLPATVKVTRTITETCWISDSDPHSGARKIHWQGLTAQIADLKMSSGDEILSDVVVNEHKCP